MKIYKIAQIDPNVLRVQQEAMESLTLLMQTITDFTEQQKNQLTEINNMTRDTQNLLQAANINIPLDPLIAALETGNLSDIESLTMQMSSGTTGSMTQTIGPMNVPG